VESSFVGKTGSLWVVCEEIRSHSSVSGANRGGGFFLPFNRTLLVYGMVEDVFGLRPLENEWKVWDQEQYLKRITRTTLRMEGNKNLKLEPCGQTESSLLLVLCEDFWVLGLLDLDVQDVART